MIEILFDEILINVEKRFTDKHFYWLFNVNIYYVGYTNILFIGFFF